ncbi:hypothetical protein L596_015116 [Steinernema carpocapsae]|uniref:Beta-lactamase-related domain-containing protein n=1 Tax=Steinernema carpocapsae TaxID=34508 RepID=A0A4U5NEZ3_STECR|nr:hypothetical protein L596_015116 [Steinernema carpocapsae]
MLKLYKAFSLGFSAFPVQLQRLLFSATFERQPRKAVGLFSQPRNEMPDVATNGTKHANYVAGEILDERFADVFDVFRTNFENGLESEGAAFSVFFEGRLVVDLYGGFANKKHGLFWQRDTKSILFSTSKSICAIIVAHLVEKGKLSYDDKVVKFWPEFEKHGKGDITAGLPYQNVITTIEDFKNWSKIAKIFEDSEPVWTPGTKTGYHALSIGLLIDQVLRRVDEKGRGVNEYFKEEIQGKYGI